MIVGCDQQFFIILSYNKSGTGTGRILSLILLSKQVIIVRTLWSACDSNDCRHSLLRDTGNVCGSCLRSRRRRSALCCARTLTVCCWLQFRGRWCCRRQEAIRYIANALETYSGNNTKDNGTCNAKCNFLSGTYAARLFWFLCFRWFLVRLSEIHLWTAVHLLWATVHLWTVTIHLLWTGSALLRRFIIWLCSSTAIIISGVCACALSILVRVAVSTALLCLCACALLRSRLRCLTVSRRIFCFYLWCIVVLHRITVLTCVSWICSFVLFHI